MNENHYLTEKGAAQLRAELKELKGPRRKDIAKRLRTAIQQGDLSENADYIATKEEQGFLEGRIQDLEIILKNATIIADRDEKADTVDVGTRVTIQEGEYPSETFQVVGVSEANPQAGRISHESPLGNALLGHHEGDVVDVKTPNGTIQVKILSIE